jgi:hypothetical protein
MKEGDIVEGGKLVLVGKSAFWIRQDGEISATTLPPKVINEGTIRDQIDTLVDIQAHGATVREVARARLLDVLLQHWGSIRDYMPRAGIQVTAGFLVVETENGPALVDKESILRVVPINSKSCAIFLKKGGERVELIGHSSRDVLAALINY